MSARFVGVKRTRSHVGAPLPPHMAHAPTLSKGARKGAPEPASALLPDGTEGPKEGEDFVEWFLRREGAK